MFFADVNCNEKSFNTDLVYSFKANFRSNEFANFFKLCIWENFKFRINRYIFPIIQWQGQS